MRILHLIYDDLDNPWVGGGGAVRTHEISCRLASRHDITVLTGNFPGAGITQERDRVVYRRVGMRSPYLLSRLSYCLSMPYIIRQMDFDLLVDDFSAHSPVLAPLHTHMPVVLLLQNLFGKHTIRKHRFLGIASYAVEQLGLRRYRNVIAVSTDLKRQAQLRLSPRARIRVIPNAPDSALLKLTPTEKPFVLFLGRLEVYQKGLDVLLDAFAMVTRIYPDVRLRLAGRGREDDECSIERQIQHLGLTEQVEWMGFVTGEAKQTLLSECLFVCMPSRFESFGMTAIEAAACGKPVVGTDIPGLSGTVLNSKTGLLVPPGRTDQLAEAMLQLIQEAEMRRHVGRAAREWARQFTWDSIAHQQEQVYRQVASLH